MPGIGDEIDGAMQQAPQPARQSMHSWSHAGKEIRPSFLIPRVDLAIPIQPVVVQQCPISADACCVPRSEEHTSELQSQSNLVCRLLLEKKNARRLPARGRRPGSSTDR